MVQPTPRPLVFFPEGTVNILLLGADQPGGTARGRTDVIIVVSVNPDVPSVSMLSIPRDFYAWIPTYGFGKINTADSRGGDYPGGGPALVKATIEYNLGIPIHYYARVNFAGFVRIVDTLGGIDVPVECGIHDTFPDPADPEQGIDVDLHPGVQHLDGQHALWYARSRWSTGDFDRNRRQQQILRALYHRMQELDFLSRIPELWEATQETVETDMGVQEVAWLGWVASRLDFANVKSRFLAPPYLTATRSPGGSYILVPAEGAFEPMIAEALSPPAVGRAAQAAPRVEVWDGTGWTGIAAVAVERLRWEGFHVVAVETVDPVARTHVVDFTTSDKGSPLELLTQLYRLRPEDVVREPTEGGPADLRIVLGGDYNPCVSRRPIQHVPTPTPSPTPSPP
jgi:LCP family protein required for cell wall assembly